MESAAYSDCVDRQFYGPGGCIRNLNRTVAEDIKQFENDIAGSRDALFEVQRVLDDEESAVEDFKALVISVGSEDSKAKERLANCFDYPGLKGKEEQEVGGGKAGIRSDGKEEEVLPPFAAKALHDLEDAMAEISREISLRNQYDLAYMRNKSQHLHTMDPGVSLGSGVSLQREFEALGLEVAEMITFDALEMEEHLEDIWMFIQNASLQYDQLHGELSYYKGFSESFFVRVGDLLEDVSGFIGTIKKVVKPFKGMMPQLEFPDVSMDVPTAHPIQSPASLSQLIDLPMAVNTSLPKRVLASISATKMSALGILHEALHLINATVEVSLAALVEDYDPPDISLEAHKDKLFDAMKAAFRGAADLKIENVEKGVHFLVKVLVTIDLIYRGFAALCMLCKYWSNSSMEQPRLVLKSDSV
ncbi:hypothetical protein HOP50_20g86390 [Chloropicon primus]|uniref:Uncharacterized protein n=1 Tax=Chloropicon primus TaxID=1764295 RepID=A0A5B8MZ15_9CHLO|nr:hypothetical protein A3770_20p86060 [Chloropicon primus]UPR05289.1 hypothetical protein HOP50_20g86390 [Chloropicon primus]|eukprot:QDZ26088.1 hypothetical protein A3770_20p86060 [Chloropicon primus]